MSVLNSWQKISRVIPVRDYGSGAAGSATISADPNVRATASGTASSTSLTIGSSILANNDVFVIHQSRGSGSGQWEVNKVASGGGTTSIVCQEALHYSFGSGAQVIKIPMYSTLTNNGYTLTAWDGSTGGIGVLAANESLTMGGTIIGTGLGFRKPGGARYSGEGTGGNSTDMQQQNGNGGGGGWNYTGDLHKHGGGGGGNATAGGGGGYSDGATSSGLGGQSSGAADLTSLTFGGGGGSGVSSQYGGAGGAAMIIFAANFIGSGNINLEATAADAGDGNGGNGGAAGGSALLVVGAANLSSIGINATGTSGTTGGSANGGSGSTGRIAIQHSGTVTGTTNPTFFDQSDPSLINDWDYHIPPGLTWGPKILGPNS